MLCHSAWLTHPTAAVEVSDCPWWPLLNLAAKPGIIQDTPQPTFSFNLSSSMYCKLCTHTSPTLHSEPFKLLKALIFPLSCNNSLSWKVPTVSPLWERLYNPPLSTLGPKPLPNHGVAQVWVAWWTRKIAPLLSALLCLPSPACIGKPFISAGTYSGGLERVWGTRVGPASNNSYPAFIQSFVGIGWREVQWRLRVRLRWGWQGWPIQINSNQLCSASSFKLQA